MDCIVHGVTKSWTWLCDFHRLSGAESGDKVRWSYRTLFLVKKKRCSFEWPDVLVRKSDQLNVDAAWWYVRAKTGGNKSHTLSLTLYPYHPADISFMQEHIYVNSLLVCFFWKQFFETPTLVTRKGQIKSSPFDYLRIVVTIGNWVLSSSLIIWSAICWVAICVEQFWGDSWEIFLLSGILPSILTQAVP